MDQKRNFIASNVLFACLAFAFIIGSFAMAILDVPFKMSILIIQYGIVLMPILVLMKVKGISIKEKFRIKKISFKTIWKSALITLLALPAAYTLNYLMTYVLIRLDLFRLQSMDLGTGGFNFVIVWLLIAFSPGLCEEIFFRGLMLSGYEEQVSPRKAIIITGILFGIFHFNIQNLLLPTFLGFIFGWLVYTTGSIVTSMIGHALFNSIGATLTYFVSTDAPVDIETTKELMISDGLTVVVSMAVFSLITTGLMVLLMNSLKGDFLHISKGDTVIIGTETLFVEEVDETFLYILEEDEIKKLNKEKLKNLDYKIQTASKEYPIYRTPETKLNTKIHYVFVGTVIVLYISFTVFTYM